jgi:hypothetical protein
MERLDWFYGMMSTWKQTFLNIIWQCFVFPKPISPLLKYGSLPSIGRSQRQTHFTSRFKTVRSHNVNERFLGTFNIIRNSRYGNVEIDVLDERVQCLPHPCCLVNNLLNTSGQIFYRFTMDIILSKIMQFNGLHRSPLPWCQFCLKKYCSEIISATIFMNYLQTLKVWHSANFKKKWINWQFYRKQFTTLSYNPRTFTILDLNERTLALTCHVLSCNLKVHLYSYVYLSYS